MEIKMKRTINKRSALTITTLAILSATVIGLSASEALARGKGQLVFDGRFYKNPMLLEYDYICQPQYIKRWVYSKAKGRKVLRTIRIEDRCNTHYKR